VTSQKKKPKPVENDTFTVYKLDSQDRRLREVIEPGPPVEKLLPVLRRSPRARELL
jgi:hypothetical protein